MENGYSPCPPRCDFPADLRVLVVDDDPACLNILEKKLKKCNYHVTTCCLARRALNLLRERKDGYDIVISEVNMPDMDGFKFLEHVGLEMDLPVIMMSVDGETSRVMKCVQLGACDYLLKPIRMKELRNIWQHVIRKRIHEAREFESFESIHLMRNGPELSDDGNSFAVEDMTSTKKRKDLDNKEFLDPSSTKKARVVWSEDLHQKFVKAVNQIGFDKLGPKKIHDLMNVPWLTRENVASHLQKYRLHKENKQKCYSSGMKNSDLATKDVGSIGLQNEVSFDSYNYLDGELQLQSVETKSHEGDHGVFDCGMPTQNSWTEVPQMQLKEHILVDESQLIASTVLASDTPSASMNEDFYSWTEAPQMQLKEHILADESQPIASTVLASDTPSASMNEDFYSWTEVPQMQLKQHILVDESQPIASTFLSSDTPSASMDEDFYSWTEVPQMQLKEHILVDESIPIASTISESDTPSASMDEDFLSYCFDLPNLGLPEYCFKI